MDKGHLTIWMTIDNLWGVKQYWVKVKTA